MVEQILPMKLLCRVIGTVLASFLLFGLLPQPANAQACTPISNAPTLYQVDRVEGAVTSTLYFTPVAEAKKYTIVYGLSEGDERYSGSINYEASTGAITYTVNDLDPNLDYYYKVRAENDCSQGPYSSWLADGAKPSPTVTGTPTGLGGGGIASPPLPVTGVETTVAAAVLSVVAVLTGLFLFAF